MIEYRQEVDQLLADYDRYKSLVASEAQLATHLAKQKIAGQVDPGLVTDYQQLKRDLQELSDAMTFSNPLVWLIYKYEAYQAEAQPISTLHDLKVHCSKAGYICTKRFNFINHQLERAGLPTLNSSSYKDSLLINSLVGDAGLNSIAAKPEFIKLWNSYEFNKEDDKVAKWLNYTMV